MNHELLEGMARMSDHELQQVEARAKFLLGSKAQGTKSETELELIHDAMARSTGEKIPYGIARKRRYFSKVRGSEAILYQFVTRELGAAQRQDRQVRYRQVLDMLKRWMRAKAIPVNLASMANCIERAPSVVDSAFPGYRESGLLATALQSVR